MREENRRADEGEQLTVRAHLRSASCPLASPWQRLKSDPPDWSGDGRTTGAGAVERCLTRFGVRRTSMTDIARELGVARTTLYRQVGSLEEAISLVTSRRFHGSSTSSSP